MKKTLMAAVVFSGLVLSARALTLSAGTQYTFTPSAYSDLRDLDHYTYWTWGFKNIEIPVGYQVKSAELSFKSIYNWDKNANWLYLYLLDRAEIDNGSKTEEGDANSGKLKKFADDNSNNDAFRANGNWDSKKPLDVDRTKLAVFSDSDGPVSKPDLTYDFGVLGFLDELDQYIKSGNNFGIGFDPDCHFFNEGVTFKLCIEKTPDVPRVPEAGATLWLLAAGLCALPIGRRFLRV